MTRFRLLASGGVIGPLGFVVAWAVAGAATPGYSSVDDAISELAATGASTRVLMTLGFVIFGVGLIAFGIALRAVLAGPAWIAAVGTGTATIGVALTPLEGWSGDGVHGVFAGLGYVTIVALPLLAAAPIARTRTHGRTWARVSVVVGALSAMCLIASTFGEHHGLWQRLGLTIGDAWIVVVAGSIISRAGTHEYRGSFDPRR